MLRGCRCHGRHGNWGLDSGRKALRRAGKILLAAVFFETLAQLALAMTALGALSWHFAPPEAQTQKLWSAAERQAGQQGTALSC